LTGYGAGFQPLCGLGTDAWGVALVITHILFELV